MISQETLCSIAEKLGWMAAADAAIRTTPRQQVAEAMLENFTWGGDYL